MNKIDKTVLYNRSLIFSGFIFLIYVFLIYGFVRLQVTNKEIYLQKSINNSIRKIQLYPGRGLIRDQDGDILVDNRPSFSIAVIPKVASNKSVKFLCKLINLDEKEVKDKIRKLYGFRPVIIARDINYKQVIAIEENRLKHPGVISIVEPKRYYPEGIMSPHIFGATGEVSKAEQIMNTVYEQGDIIGKTGLEKKYDLDLRGSKGIHYLRVDASGRELGTYDINRDVSPIHGSDLHLYLDYETQQFAESLMVGQRGALVAIDVRNGGIISLVSKPDFDPRILTGRIYPAIWNKLQTDESHPLYSRAIQSVYPPGSTYKIVAAAAALQEKIITPRWKEYCPGYFRLGRKTIKCWKVKGHGLIDLNEAIKGSCNVYFLKIGLKIGIDIWTKYSRMFGFGARTGIDLPNESKGLVPSTEYFNKRYPKGWTRGNLANLAIGQGELLVTPLQLAQFAMILANKGVYHTPHLVDHIYNYSTHSTTKFPVDTKYITGISDDVYYVVREGMRAVVNGGTGWLGKVPGIEMAGKTGSAQNPHGDTHAWFMAFAPYDFPEVAIAVVVENAGAGGGVAAPIARKFLEKYFYNRLIPRAVAKKDTTDQINADSLTIPFDFNEIQPIQLFNAGENEDQ
jgi:penicillin-binding protein 2